MSKPLNTIDMDSLLLCSDGDYIIGVEMNPNPNIFVFAPAFDIINGIINQFQSGYNSTVTAIFAKNGFLFTSSEFGPGSLRKWNYLSGNLVWSQVNPINGHSDKISSINGWNNFIYTSSFDGTIKKWDFDTGSFISNIVDTRVGSSFFPIDTTVFDDQSNSLFVADVSPYGLIPSGNFGKFQKSIAL